MASDLKRARAILRGALMTKDLDTIYAQVNGALSLMTRTYTKSPCRRGNKVTPAIRAAIIALLPREDLMDTEISELVFGNAGGAGRVSEIRAGLR